MENSEKKMTTMEIRQAIAESSQTRIPDMMRYLRNHHKGKYDVKVAREQAREMKSQMSH